MNIINDSVIATGQSKIKNVNNTKINIIQEKRKSFWKGFIIGILSSLIASVFWYVIKYYLEL